MFYYFSCFHCFSLYCMYLKSFSLLDSNITSLHEMYKNLIRVYFHFSHDNLLNLIFLIFIHFTYYKCLTIFLSFLIFNHLLDFLFLLLFFGCVSCRILVPWPGVKSGALAVRTLSPNQWTTGEFPQPSFKEIWIIRKKS